MTLTSRALGGLRSSASTVTVPETIIEPTLTDGGEGDHDRFAHFVRKQDIVRSAVDGVPVVALCGKKWIPNRNPDNYPVCPTCKEIFETLKSMGR
jgi:hypothetical protein